MPLLMPMLKPSRPKRAAHLPALRGVSRQGALGGALVALVVSGLGAVGAWTRLDFSLSDALFRARGRRDASSRIVVLLSDDTMAQRAGKFPLPRRFYAQAVRQLTQAGVRTIAFEVVFETPSNPRDDELLRRACAESKRVIQGGLLSVPPPVPFKSPLPARFGVVEHRSPAVLRAAARGLQQSNRLEGQVPVSLSMPPLLESAPRLGVLSAPVESDGTYRRILHVVRHGNTTLPSLALAAAAHSGEVAPGGIEARDDEVLLHNRNGEVVRRIPLDVGGNTLINWDGPGPGTDSAFYAYPMTDLFDGKVPPGLLRDSVVLIGSARTGSYSPLATPFSPRVAPVFLEAGALDDIISNRMLHPLAFWQLWLATLGLGALSGALGARRSALWGLAGTLGLAVLVWSAGVSALHHDIFVLIAAPLIGVVAAGVTGMVVRQRREARELAFVRRVFGVYNGDKVLRRLDGGMPKLDGEQREIAVLFCDIQGFSGIAEALRDKPEQLLGLLNGHFAPLVAALDEWDAYVDNYLGDMVIAVWGAPFSAGSLSLDTRNAVAAALEFVRLVEQANERRAPDEPRIEVGIGVHCGRALVGNLGAAQKMHYTAIGDVVNVGARIESLTRSFAVPLLVSEEVVRACASGAGDDGEWEFVAQTPVKGRAEEVRVYAPAHLRGTPGAPDKQTGLAPSFPRINSG